ncbi:uncharacterized protein LOC124345613 [Daphnia pulicaria]|uniref:uncharacterized protein LOC124345613 n=1 Tax=Daphnia pulicaria TaxID=35523 RepID=UPI001EEBECEA|nr:uncharacterized protein LOC124345613 [Daphnia pulicaria]
MEINLNGRRFTYQKMKNPLSPKWMIKSLIAFLILCVGVFCQSDESTSSWAKLQISPSELCSMPYGSFRINIYEHANNHKATTTNASVKKYFYAPIALLDHQSAKSFFNNVTKQPEVRFRVEMWNPKVESKVVNYLTEFLSQPIKSNQVQVIPFDKVILASTSPSATFTLKSNWLPYQLDKWLQLTLSCFHQRDCNQLAAAMRTNPKQFNDFKLLFSLSSQTSQTKQTVIRIDNIVSGQMMAQMLQKFNESTKEALLTASDEKKLLTESMTNVLVDTFDDSDVVSQNSESQIYNMLKSLLVSSRNIIKEQSDKMWDSVFWNEDNYRPDKTSKTMNDIYNKLDKEEQKKLIDTFQNTNTFEFGAGVSILGITSFKTKFKKELSRHGSTTKEDINKLLQESKNHGEWDGEKFVPKPLALSRVNLAKLRDTQSFQDRKVSVRYSTAVLSTPIHFLQNSELTATDEWQELKDELKETQNRLSYALKLLTKRRITFEKLEKQQNDTNATVFNLINDVNERTSAIVDIGKMPASCADLRKIGHIKSGFYSIMGKSNMETVHCNFAKQQRDPDFQKVIGSFVVKSGPVYFHAQSTTSFRSVNTAIPFNLIRMNVGNAISSSGLFVAPRSGKYFFAFTGLSPDNYVRVEFQMRTGVNSNWIKLGHAFGQKNYQTLTLQYILQLGRGDQIRLMLQDGVLHSDTPFGPITSFSGWLMEENIF